MEAESSVTSAPRQPGVLFLKLRHTDNPIFSVTSQVEQIILFYFLPTCHFINPPPPKKKKKQEKIVNFNIPLYGAGYADSFGVKHDF